MAGIISQGDVSGGSMGVSTTALAPKAPRKNWPSAPMFHSFMVKARHRPVARRMSGVAFTSVSEMTPTSPKAALTM